MKHSAPFHLQRGHSPVLISVPHAGTSVPAGILKRFSVAAREQPDADWHVDRLYAWAPEAGAGMLIAPFSRYVIDLNRPPDDAPLYDSSATRLLTGLVPLTTFTAMPIYPKGSEPDAQEIGRRVKKYWNPYHQCLHDELARIRNRYGYAVLLDTHSIRSEVPLLFSGRLPDLNLGTNSGRSAAASLLAAARAALDDPHFSLVVDGRFKGGYITRHFGAPEQGIHALQLEMAQSAYMQEQPPRWNADLARPMQGVLQRLVQSLMQWKPDHDRA